MPLANTAERYGSVTKTFHWLTALLIVTLIPLGIIANGMPYDTAEELAAKARLFSIHKTLGVATFFVALTRIAWALSQPKPGPLHPGRRVETFAAETVHWLLYGSLLLVPLSGWVHHAATTGFAPIWWPLGQSLPFVPKDDGVAAISAGLHIVFERVLLLSILLHVAGALKHHVIDRDATLRRMWFGPVQVPQALSVHRHHLPFATALAAWATALIVGAQLGVYDSQAATVPTASLDQVQSDWTVDTGTLAITVTQFGSEVEGRFADWTAAIAFDETVTTSTAGRVDVTIAIGSLTLGSVTDQAMGPDYFNATDFPTARFSADILPITDGYRADGTLTIKDESVPVALPFGLSIDGDTASMTGSLTLDRRTFGIGDNMADESTLEFAVEVDVNLTATRTAD